MRSVENGTVFNSDSDIADIAKVYKSKKGAHLSPLEEEQIWALSALYGKGAVLLVLKALKNVDIPAVSRALMQIGGFSESVPPSLKGILYTVGEAEKKYDKTQIEVATRLSKLVGLLSDPSLVEFVAADQNGVTYHQLWKQQIGQPPSTNEKKVLTDALMKYGGALVARAISVSSGKKVGNEKQRIELFKKWLEAAASRNFDKLERITREAGIDGLEVTWALPAACPFLVSAYFSEKTLNEVDESDTILLSTLVKKSSFEEVVFSICSIPAAEFSVDRLTREHYQRFGTASDLTNYFIEKNKVVYKCDACKKYIGDVQTIRKSSGYLNICPVCSNKSDVHRLHQEIEGLDDDLLQRFRDEEPMLYEDNYFLYFKSTEKLAGYCSTCGHFL